MSKGSNTLDKVKVAFQYLLPKHLISRLVGKFAAAQAGNITTAAIKWFIKRYQIDMSEAANPDPHSYKTFNAFFTRKLKSGIRPICQTPNTIVQPVDGAISQFGGINSGQIFQAKGHNYSALALLGNQKEDAMRFDNGNFATIYLSPKDYHRIHMPIKGTLSKMTYVPGDLFSVNPLTARNVPDLFARNERVITIFETEIGPLAMILVGATIVASIETVWAGTITPPCGSLFSKNYPTEGESAITLEKGEEMGRFKLGSTVIMLFGQNAIDEFDHTIKLEAITRMGQAFASINSKNQI